MKTFAQTYIANAKRLAPHHADLQNIEPEDNAETIDEKMFREGEYLGGMAAILLALTEEQLGG